MHIHSIVVTLKKDFGYCHQVDTQAIKWYEKGDESVSKMMDGMFFKLMHVALEHRVNS